jgi:hypothetical protein
MSELLTQPSFLSIMILTHPDDSCPIVVTEVPPLSLAIIKLFVDGSFQTFAMEQELLILQETPAMGSFFSSLEPRTLSAMFISHSVVFLVKSMTLT